MLRNVCDVFVIFKSVLHYTIQQRITAIKRFSGGSEDRKFALGKNHLHAIRLQSQ